MPKKRHLRGEEKATSILSRRSSPTHLWHLFGYGESIHSSYPPIKRCVRPHAYSYAQPLSELLRLVLSDSSPVPPRTIQACLSSSFFGSSGSYACSLSSSIPGRRAISMPQKATFGVTLLEARYSPGPGRIYLGEQEFVGFDRAAASSKL